MTNLEKYDRNFLNTFPITKETLPEARYLRTKDWTSLGHVQLISAMEETFGIQLETLDVMDFSSYEKGKEILAKYGVEL